MSQPWLPNWNGFSIPYEAPTEVLRLAVRLPGPSAWPAFRALAARPGPEALAVLSEAARHPDPHLRRAAIEAIGLHPDGRSASALILAALRDGAAVVVRAACEVAARWRWDGAHDPIAALIADPEEATRLSALHALESLGQPSDVPPVFARFLRDPSGEVRKRAAWVLRSHVDAEHWEAVFAVWSKETLPRHRTWACDLARKFGGTSVLPALDTLAIDANGHVRSAAARAIAAIRAEPAPEGPRGL